jgi:hypothetical protein
MDAKDSDSSTRDGPDSCPADKACVIVLVKDNLLLIPHSVRTFHNVFTLGPRLMEGGMLWDMCDIPALLKELL